MKKEHGNIIKTILALCEREQGCSLREAADAINRPLNFASRYLSKSMALELSKAGCHGKYRYFTDPEKSAKHHELAVAEREERLRLAKQNKNKNRAKREREKRAAIVKPKRASTALKPSGLTLSTKRQDQERKREHVSATIIWPEHVKVQKAPTPRDDRFTFTPPSKDWRGVISQDQKERWAA